jgi:peptidoglycan-associated lipoprotein
MQELFAQSVQDIFFEFDKSDISAEAAASLQRTADFLRSYPDARVLIEGHCDEIGGPRYNTALGARRGEAVKNYLVSLGVNAGQLATVSRGKEAPFCTESSQDSCRALNRRAHFVLQ